MKTPAPRTLQTSTPNSATTASVAPVWRVVDTRTGADRPFGRMVARLADTHAVFVGELHDDPQTHRVEEQILIALHRRWRQRTVLAMEMFERDQQTALDRYLDNLVDEATFLKSTTVWKNYPTDYRPMVEYCRSHRIPVVASNAPVAAVRKVGREGVAALDSLPLKERMEVAAATMAPMGDTYQRRFFETMQGMGQHGPGGDTMLRRIYEAQCVRDDTMAESVARALAGDRRVVHVNGSFHSDAGLGTVARLRWRQPIGVDIAVVKVVPVKGDIRRADPRPMAGEADWLVFVPDQRPEPPRANS